MNSLCARLHELLASGVLELPSVGGGMTAMRHQALSQWGREDLSLARMAEAHTDAIAILAEGGRTPKPGTLYGVWASDGPQSRLVAEEDPAGWRLTGTKQYCSGSSLVGAALVTAHAPEGLRLFEVRLSESGVNVAPSTWASPAFDDTATGSVLFDQVKVAGSASVGAAGWYLKRPGFWHGAIGPAACWAGGAMYLIDAAASLNRKDPHSRAQIGALRAIEWGLMAVLSQSAREIDMDPCDERGEGRGRALKVRHLIERWCTETLDRFGRATGPQLMAFDVTVARQHAALALYIRQCHAERDLEGIGE